MGVVAEATGSCRKGPFAASKEAGAHPGDIDPYDVTATWSIQPRATVGGGQWGRSGDFSMVPWTYVLLQVIQTSYMGNGASEA